MYALIENNVVRELFDRLPHFHSDVLALVEEVPAETLVGWVKDEDGDIVPPNAGFNIWNKQAGDYVLDADACRAAKQLEIVTAAQIALGQIVSAEYCDYEQSSWDQQVKEAEAFASSASADVPLLTAIAAARGVEVEYLAGRVLANAVAWKAASGAIIGQRLAYQDQLESADTAEAIQAIEVEYVL